MQQSLSLDTFSDLLGNLYQGPLETIPWATFLNQLNVHLHSKYVTFILRADNQGEGGIMALTALARRAAAGHPKLRTLLVVCGLIGAALFYGDSMITPAISVLSAIEGLGLAFDGIDHWVVPLSLVVLMMRRCGKPPSVPSRALAWLRQ